MPQSDSQRKTPSAANDVLDQPQNVSTLEIPSQAGAGNAERDEQGHSEQRHMETGQEEANEQPVFDEARVMARVKGLYQEMLDAPVPEEFMRLIQALEQKEAQ